MEDIVIRVKNVSKKYKIGSQDDFGGSLKNRIGSFFTEKLRSKKSNTDKTEKIFYALEDINFEVKKGEVLGVIGQNGAGKTTLLKILSGITEPTNGCIEIQGRVASILEVGTGFHPDLTGRENVYLNAKMLGLTKKEIDSRFDEIVEFSGVKNFINTAVKHYSSGMYVRLAFSVVANIDADILLFDEVLNFGDTEFQQQCKNKMRELINNNKTVILISHNMNDIVKLCNRVVCLDKGKVVEMGDANLSVTHYLQKIDEALNYQMKYLVEKSILENINKETSADYELDFVGLTMNKVSLDRPIFINEPFEIRFKLKKFSDDGLLMISANFFTLGNVFLATNSYFARNHSIQIRNKGTYDLSVEIPNRFFNSTFYDVDIYITDELKGKAQKIKSALSFKILPDPNELKMKVYDNHSYFHGPMYTSLNWSAEYLSAN